MQPPNQGNLELKFLVPIVASDGNGIFISNDGDVPTLTFFQVRSQSDGKVFADVVAAVRMGSLEDLKNLQASIDETMRNHTNREV